MHFSILITSIQGEMENIIDSQLDLKTPIMLAKKHNYS